MKRNILKQVKQISAAAILSGLCLPTGSAFAAGEATGGAGLVKASSGVLTTAANPGVSSFPGTTTLTGGVLTNGGAGLVKVSSGALALAANPGVNSFTGTTTVSIAPGAVVTFKDPVTGSVTTYAPGTYRVSGGALVLINTSTQAANISAANVQSVAKLPEVKSAPSALAIRLKNASGDRFSAGVFAKR